MRDLYRDWVKNGELENILLLVKKWREDGAGLDEIAEKLKISRTTLFKYQNDHADFADALKRGREIVDTEVENSLKKECVGYYYDETVTTTTAIIDETTGAITNLKRVETKTFKKYARPSPTAIAYYLNNRLPDKWRNRVVTSIDITEIDDNRRQEIEDFLNDARTAGNIESSD